MASLVLNNKSLEVLEVEQNDLLKKNQDCYTGKIIVNPKYSSLSNSYNEGVRINQASNGWANVLFGASHNSTTGCEEGWLMGRRGEVSGSAGIGDFSITYATSQANGLILKKDGTNPIWYGNRMALEKDTILKSGDTMTGMLGTSTNGISNGALPLEACTDVRDILNKVRYTNGCMGSLYLTNSSEMWNTWYNYLWIPHREGGNNGGPSGDNCSYGTLLLFPMTTQTGTWWSVQYINDSYYIRQH